YLNRGLARVELKQYAEALTDFQKALELGPEVASAHAGRGMALEALGRPEEADAAFEAAFARTQTASAPVRVRLSWVYGFAVANRLPQKALKAFEDVIHENPNHPQALYGRALLAVQQGQQE